MARMENEMGKSISKTAARNRTPQDIAAELMAAKAAENAANVARVELEAEFISAVSFDKVEGSQTFNEGPYRVTLTAKLDRKASDMDDFIAAAKKLPADLQPIKIKTEIDVAGIKYLMTEKPDLFKIVAKYLVTKPAKTAVVVVKTEE